MEYYNLQLLIAVALLVTAQNCLVAAANNHAAPSQPPLGSRALASLDRDVSEARGDWFNEIGFPQQYFGGQLALFKVWVFYMVAFLKVFLLMGIWTPNREEEAIPVLYSPGYGYGNQYYGYPSWQPYG